MRAMTWPTVTVSPSSASSSVTVPLAGAGSSTSTLSVEISTIVSSRLMNSPTFACHSRIVPSVTDSPAPGVTMSIVAPSLEGAAGAPAPERPRLARATPLPAVPLPVAAGALLAPGTGSAWPFAAAAGAPPFVLISASTSPTLTVSPSAK